MQYKDHYESPIGGITLASDGEALTGLWFDGSKYFGSIFDEECASERACEQEEIPAFADAKKWLDIYFSGKDPGFLPPIKMMCTGFRKEVWEAMLDIPYGETTSYGEIADRIAKKHGIKKMSARAVGGAVGHNDISIIIPCHRVIGKDGSMTGYGGGLDKKIWLLEHEGYPVKG